MDINKHGLFFFTDIDGPYIFADNESPQLASSTVELTCLVYKTDPHDITEILLKVALNTITLTQYTYLPSKTSNSKFK
jgi:hypothetical protein